MIFYRRNEIIQIFSYDNYDDFSHLNFVFSQKNHVLTLGILRITLRII
jgi:hypothetical protein